MSAQLSPIPKLTFFDANGLPLVGGLLYTYVAGTSTPQQTFTDGTGITPNTNPIVLDGNGQCTIWIGKGVYKYVLQSSTGVQLWSVDQVANILPGSITTDLLAPNSVTSAIIADGSVGTSELASKSVTTDKIADGAVTTTQIGAGAVTATKLDPNLDVSSLGIEVIFGHQSDYTGAAVKATPQYPWSAPNAIALTSIPPSWGTGVAWTPNGEYCAISHLVSPFLTIFQRQNESFTKLPLPFVTPSSNTTAIAFSADGNVLAVGSGTSPYLYVYKRSGSGFTILPSPATLPSGPVTGLSFSPSGEILAVASSAAPYALFYQMVCENLYGQSGVGSTVAASNYMLTLLPQANLPEGSGSPTATEVNTAMNQLATQTAININALGTVANGGSAYQPFYLTSPASGSLPTSGATGVSFSADGQFVSFSLLSSPYVITYQRTFLTFTRLPDPTTLPTISGMAVKWAPDMSYLAVGQQSATAPLVLYSFNQATQQFSVATLPSTVPPATIHGFAWSPNSQTLACAHEVTPYITIYSRSGTTFTKNADPSTLPQGQAVACAFNANNRFLSVVSQASPYITIYETSGTIRANGLLFTRQVSRG